MLKLKSYFYKNYRRHFIFKIIFVCPKINLKIDQLIIEMIAKENWFANPYEDMQIIIGLEIDKKLFVVKIKVE